MMTKFTVIAAAVLTLGVSAAAVQAQMAEPAPLPDPAKFKAQGQVKFVGIGDILEYKALDKYSEPGFVTRTCRRGQVAGRQGPPAERADGLQDRQHARRRRRLWRRDAPRHRRPAGRLELLGRPDPGLGRHRHRPVECLTRTGPLFQVKAEELAAAAEPRQELGMVGRRPRADHAPHRRCQVVRRRPVQCRRCDVLLGK